MKIIEHDGGCEVELANGARLLYIQHTPSPNYAVGAYVFAGHYDDYDRKPGLAHFLEHMLFEGSDEVPDISLSEYFEKNYYQHIGASTSDFLTNIASGYGETITLRKDELVPAMTSLVRSALTPSINPTAMDAERIRIISEIHLRERQMAQNPDREAQADFVRKIRPDCFAPGISRIGEVSDAAGTTVEDLRDFHGKYYTASRFLFVVTGPTFPLELAKALDDTFSAVKPGEYMRKSPMPFHSGETVNVSEHIKENSAFIVFDLPVPLDVREQIKSALAAEYLSRYWRDYTLKQKKGYDASCWPSNNLAMASMSINFPYNTKEQALQAWRGFIQYVVEAGIEVDEEKFRMIHRGARDSDTRYEKTGPMIINDTVAMIGDGFPFITPAEKMAICDALSPADVRAFALDLLQRPMALMSSVSDAAQAPSLAELQEVIAEVAPASKRPADELKPSGAIATAEA
ncbi:MAG: M16 family metallopeptidase [Bdellovibrionales bacterium]